MKRILSTIAVCIALSLLAGSFALPATAATNTAGFSAEVARLVNEERAAAGLPALKFGNSKLNACAQIRAREIVEFFGHFRPNGHEFVQVLLDQGVSFTMMFRGENIAKGQASPAQVMAEWMASPGHSANILSTDFNWMGVGVYESGGVLYWVQLFVYSGSLTDDGDTGDDPDSGGTGITTGDGNVFTRIWNWIVNAYQCMINFFGNLFNFKITA